MFIFSINLEIPRGCLAAIVGSVGSGKSTLLSAIVGEAQLSGDECHVRVGILVKAIITC